MGFRVWALRFRVVAEEHVTVLCMPEPNPRGYPGISFLLHSSSSALDRDPVRYEGASQTACLQQQSVNSLVFEEEKGPIKVHPNSICSFPRSLPRSPVKQG